MSNKGAKFLAGIPAWCYNISFAVSYMFWLTFNVQHIAEGGWSVWFALIAIVDFFLVGSICGLLVSVIIGSIVIILKKHLCSVDKEES